MTKEELDAIEARANAATEGPWETDLASPFIPVGAAGGPTIYECECPPPEGSEEEAQQRRDAEFIAAAREDVPLLIAEVRRMRALLTIALETTAKHGGYVFTEAALRVALGLDK